MTFWVIQSKDRSYITNVVSWYRHRLDQALAQRGWARSSSGQSSIDFEPDPVKTFNRGYTPYFLPGRGEPPGALQSPKMVGERLGVITTAEDGTFVLQTTATLHNGDGLCWFDAQDELCGTAVNAVETAGAEPGTLRITPEKMAGLYPGLPVYRNHDHEFLRQLERSQPVRQISIGLRLKTTPRGFVLHVEDEDGNRTTGILSADRTPARKPDLAQATTHRQLAKTGGTPFACTQVDLAWDQPYFLPVAQLNQLRREVLDRLVATRAANRPRPQGGILINRFPYPEQSLTYRGNVLNQKAAEFYRRHGVQDIEPAAESGLDMAGRVVMRTRYCIQHQLGLCDGNRGASRLRQPLYLVDDDGHRYPLRFDCGACEMEVLY